MVAIVLNLIPSTKNKIKQKNQTKNCCEAISLKTINNINLFWLDVTNKNVIKCKQSYTYTYMYPTMPFIMLNCIFQ